MKRAADAAEAVVSVVGCYSLALEVPKAFGAKCVGLKRDTEETSVFLFLFFFFRQVHCCIVNGVLSEKHWNNIVSCSLKLKVPNKKSTVTVVLKEHLKDLKVHCVAFIHKKLLLSGPHGYVD